MSSATKSAIQTASRASNYQPTGVWARINNFLAVDPKRSTGVPLNPQFRNPPPGGNDPTEYEDPVTVPAGDLAENPYWKRDVRRAYPKLSVVKQPDMVALLTVGSAASPKEDVLQVGDAGAKQLIQVKEEGDRGLSAYFAKEKDSFKGVLAQGGMPPTPPSMHRQRKQYSMIEEAEQTYGDTVKYPCRTFASEQLEFAFCGFAHCRPTPPHNMESFQEVSVAEIVLSCHICQATLPEICVIAGDLQAPHAANDGSGFDIAKLWILQCSHVTCAAHLVGGVVPFHPKDKQPQAACPVCMIENNDHTWKNMYGIHSMRSGDYDEHIPELWMKCPPIRMEDPGPEMEAMRVSLFLILAEIASDSLRVPILKHRRKRQCALHAKVSELESRLTSLGHTETKLRKWESRRSLIKHYLGVVTDMSRYEVTA
nr:nadh-ubiquinone oxidoreductase 21.3 kda subunit [Quercus suber]